MLNKSFSLCLLVLGCCTTLSMAKPTEQRLWTASNGKTVTATATSIEGNKVVLKKENGDTVKVPLNILVDADREFLKQHFSDNGDGKAEATDSGAMQAKGLPHPMGEVVGPIQANDNSSYFLYLPTTLKEGRKAPLMFVTSATGGSKGRLQSFSKAAELCGWIIATSIESKNGQAAETAENNFKHAKACVEHLYSTLPIDQERTYYSGGSGGGAAAFVNSSRLQCMGVMPFVSYIPANTTPKGKDFFIIGGSRDVGRYGSGKANKVLGKKAVHRVYPGGHGGMPIWMAEDGYILFQTKFLSRNYSSHREEAQDFEARLLTYLDEAKSEQPYRVYANAKLIEADLEKSPNRSQFKKLVEELEKNELNVKYYEALDDIDELSKDKLSEVSGAANMRQADPAVTRAAEKLLKKYTGVPIIEEALKGLADKPL